MSLFLNFFLKNKKFLFLFFLMFVLGLSGFFIASNSSERGKVLSSKQEKNEASFEKQVATSEQPEKPKDNLFKEH